MNKNLSRTNVFSLHKYLQINKNLPIILVLLSRLTSCHPAAHYYPVPSFPYFLPFPILTCCAILPTSFGGKGPHLRRRLVARPLHQTVSQLRFSGVFLGCKANARRSVNSSQEPGQQLVAPPHQLKAFLAAAHSSMHNR